MNATIVAAAIAGITSLAIGAVTAYFAWKQRHTEVNSPSQLADAFNGLVSSLRAEIARLEARQVAADIRIERLEQRARDDEETIRSLGHQIDWLVERIDDHLRAEFEALFRPYK